MSALDQLRQKLSEFDPNFTTKQEGHLQWICTATINGEKLRRMGLSEELAIVEMLRRVK